MQDNGRARAAHSSLSLYPQKYSDFSADSVPLINLVKAFKPSESLPKRKLGGRERSSICIKV